MLDVVVVIVTHNSELVLPACIGALKKQTLQPKAVVIVDSLSANQGYLDFKEYSSIEVIRVNENVGFCSANNIGYSVAKQISDWVLFLNPDAYLPPDWIERAIEIAGRPNINKFGCIGGPLWGFSLLEGGPNGRVDSLGIYRSRLGRWFDKYQGRALSDVSLPQESYEPEALCGALMLCRTSALEEITTEGSAPFDERFFMYKEDIDLSLRLRRAGWKLLMCPELAAYHCRGWHKKRREVPRWARLMSARNEVRLCLKHRSPYIFTALLKVIWVRLFER